MHKRHKGAYYLMKQNISRIGIILLLSALFLNACGEQAVQFEQIKTGCENTASYLPLLKGKSVALVVNHTSLIGKSYIVDSLISLGINLVRIFSPEHGFRGDADAGMAIDNMVDNRTGLPVTSLYGVKTKPAPDDLKGIDVVVYDIQDVGVRFYTYISTLHYVLEACAESNIPVLVLDRPDPLGFYVDGPVLNPENKSFVGLHPIPVVYGMTIGELARMINGEGWLSGGLKCDLKVIPCDNYNHDTCYRLPVNPSPNLNSMEAVYLYPSLCLFEGTIMSLGRGTSFPFRVLGHPEYPVKDFSFIPQSTTVNENPMYLGKTCYGIDLRSLNLNSLKQVRAIDLQWLISVYKTMGIGEAFFTDYIDKLAGTDDLRIQIIKGWNEAQIRNSWQQDLVEFKTIRKKYLLYEDYSN